MNRRPRPAFVLLLGAGLAAAVAGAADGASAHPAHRFRAQPARGDLAVERLNQAELDALAGRGCAGTAIAAPGVSVPLLVLAPAPQVANFVPPFGTAPRANP